jgi:acetyl-CoA acetyltransferase
MEETLMSLAGRTAIAGIGSTEFSKDSGRSELRLAVEAILRALGDAGLRPAQVDGLVSFNMDNNEMTAVARNLGIPELRLFAQTPWGGGGGCGTVALAAAAITCGQADVVVCYRAMNERSQQRFGQPPASTVPDGLVTGRALDNAWSRPFGMATAAAMMALSARRYMHEFDVTGEDFGRVAVQSRDFAATNPAAWFYQRPITLDDHQSSRMIADPLRLFDCCQESDGAVALVVTSAERAADLAQPTVLVRAAAQGAGSNHVQMASPYRDSLTSAQETEVVARQLWTQSRLTPENMDVAVIYDHFSFAVLMQLEALGFCKPGEAADLVRSGATGRGGSIPVNTNGGQLGEAYIHGFNGVAEAVRQLRGTAVNQVDGAANAVVTSGSHVPTSGLVLARD